MKRAMVCLLAMVFVCGLFGLAAAEVKNGKLYLKVGDEVYICGCGEGCGCDTISMKPGKCACGADLVKAKVTKVEKGKAYFMVDGKERVLKTAGKYACACGAGCNCDTISQKPGKCHCGKDMKEVK